MIGRRDGFGLAALVFALLALAFPLAGGENPLAWTDRPAALAAVLAVGGVGALVARKGVPGIAAALAILAVVFAGALAAIKVVDGGAAGNAGWGIWSFIFALWALTWRGIARIAAYRSLVNKRQQLANVFVPAAFGLWLLFLWEMVCLGFGVPGVLLPPPSAIFIKLIGSPDILWADFVQTFMKAVISGYVMAAAPASWSPSWSTGCPS